MQQLEQIQQQQADPKKILENKKIKEVKYKIYIFILFIVLWIFWDGFSLTLTQIDDLKTQKESSDQKLSNIKILKSSVDNDKKLISDIESQKDKIIWCFNTPPCDILKNNNFLDRNLDAVRNYILIGKNSSSKMDFDQKRLLANINDFLTEWVNSNVNIITFGMTWAIDKTLWVYKVPITMSINFSSKNDLMRFLTNVEDRINIKDKENNVLYKISMVNYDIASYQNAQTTSITMDAYFYK